MSAVPPVTAPPGTPGSQDDESDRGRSQQAYRRGRLDSERFDGRNFALRLVELGYTNVDWYRGGREAWEVTDLPETELEHSAVVICARAVHDGPGTNCP